MDEPVLLETDPFLALGRVRVVKVFFLDLEPHVAENPLEIHHLLQEVVPIGFPQGDQLAVGLYKSEPDIASLSREIVGALCDANCAYSFHAVHLPFVGSGILEDTGLHFLDLV